MEKIISPFENLLDMFIAEKKKGFCRIGISFREDLTNPHGNFHGGVIASLVDTATVQSLRTLIPHGPYLTVNLDIRYKNPSTDKQIFAEAKPTQLKGKFFLTHVKVKDTENKVIAEAKVKSFLPAWRT